jgi:signal transduction histidine kinase
VGDSGLRGPNAQTGLRGPNAQTGLRGPNAGTGLRGPNAGTGRPGPNTGTGPWRSVRVRITAVSVLVFALAFGAVSFALVASVQRILVDQKEDELAGTGVRIRQRVEQGETVDRATEPLPDQRVCLAGPDGVDLPPGIDPEALPPVCGSVGVGGPGARAGAPAGDVLVRTIEVSTPEGVRTLQLMSPLGGVRQSIDALTRVLLVGFPVLVAAVGAMVWWLVGRALQPVEQLRVEVDTISHSTLDRRLRSPGSHDEIDRLARTMNDMLDRLERSSIEQRRFVSDASHELRTPLSTIRTALDVARRHPASLPPADALDRIDRAARRTEELVAELLELARIDEAGAPPAGPVDLDVVVAAAVADVGDDRVVVSGSAGTVSGDATQLRRLVANLVGNAVAHARAEVRVGLAGDAGDATLTVDDDGPGIPPGARATVFQRFARLDGARTRTGAEGGGWGLGLAIAEAVVRRHGGTIAIAEAPLGGARVEVHLPR